MGGINGWKTAILGVLALSSGIGETAAFASTEENGRNAAVVATEENGQDAATDSTDFAAFEEAFFELLGRCDSPLLAERDAAEDALFERFAQFEAVWQDRRFLTNGEISPEARRRFELAEARFREKTLEDCLAAVQAVFELDAEDRKDGESASNGKNDGNTEDGGNGADLLGRVRLRWGETARIVYWAPDWNAFERRDGDGRRWRSSARFSTPELEPEFGATELTLETRWELVEPETGKDAENKAAKKNGEFAKNAKETTVVGTLEGLIGADRRDWTLPLPELASEDGKNKKDDGIGEDERFGRNATSGENKRGNEGEKRENVFQSGELRAVVEAPRLKSNGEITATVHLEFAEAFDAFDSHRLWWDNDDFALCVEFDGGETAAKRRWSPIRLQIRERSTRGSAFALDFPSDPAIREALERGTARLSCRIPRFFFRASIPISGVETAR